MMISAVPIMINRRRTKAPNRTPSRSLLLFLLLLSLSIGAAKAVDNLNLKPRQFVSEVSSRPRFRSELNSNNKDQQDQFRLLGVSAQTDSVLIGGRDALYNLSASTLAVKKVIKWSAPGQTIEECHMKGKSESECHNFIRVATQLKSGRTLVCGTHAFSPMCRQYEHTTTDDGGGSLERDQFSGQAISPYDPKHNSTWLYSDSLNQIFVGTVSDIGAGDPLLFRRSMTTSSSSQQSSQQQHETLRTQKDDRVLDNPHFVGSFAHGDYVYFFYRETAAESLDNNREPQVYSRVGRVCANEAGGPPPAQDKWSTFLKARLNCSIAGEGASGDASFYFNEIQAISSPIGNPSGDVLIYAIFHTPRSLLMSAVCAFRLSQIDAVFEHGRFKTQRTPTGQWAPMQKFYSNPTERPGQCVSDSRRQSAESVFIVKNPLMYEPVPAEGLKPLVVEGPGRPEMTSIAVLGQVSAVRGQLHDLIYIGKADGTLEKVVESQVNETTVVIESVQVFPTSVPVLSLSLKEDSPPILLAMASEQMARLPLEHCSLRQSCSSCVHLSDPHCAWDLDALRCVHKQEWSRGSYVQNLLKGVSEQCPGTANGLSDDDLYSVDEDPLMGSGGGGPKFSQRQNDAIGHLEAGDNAPSSSMASTGNLALLALAIVLASVAGFVVGWRISKWRVLAKSARGAASHSSGGSAASAGSAASDDYADAYGLGRRRQSLIAPSSIMGHHKLDTHIYSQTPSGAGPHPHGKSSATTIAGADAVSLVFGGHCLGSHFIPVQQVSISNGGSGLATPRYDARTAMLGSNGMATLPRDYRVKKVYL